MTYRATAPAAVVPGRGLIDRATLLIPGLGLCVAVTVAAFAVQWCEEGLFGQAWLEALVLAILIGTALRTAWTPSARWFPGVSFSAKFLLEAAVVLLGASISAATILSAGPALLLGIAGVVVAALAASYGIGRLLGLPIRLALLVACGNSICGNSAIAAVAPVIGADGDDVASSIAFTAVLGVAVVLGLPLLGMALHLSGLQYGALAGLTVYAVPQVIAAAAPLGAIAVQVGTLVKLVRVLMLGPVCLLLSLLAPRLREEADERPPHVTAGDRPRPGYPPVHHLVPWFIQGFLVMVALRSLDLIPHGAVEPMGHAATLLTVVSMAALGLGVDIRTVARAGGRVTAAVILSLLVLGGISLALIHAIGLA
ncbi:YeiH family protein [Azospirillum picis]|uniref:Integral membrane protein (TIGR00698 family) n=1 Tax=Azospirillum picis TaxID=488438 RepID=A0ABU0MQE2_9PROT|nr:putative sulfate exporter family transporter [Azospirillum picis]MBP2302020.1 putative integral membrane protein (TIGR00698 family) [Azospirillum picis]MDQ0535689.1 putative integral membrane protein (TIGR00698 family) [Azospirillum picis]